MWNCDWCGQLMSSDDEDFFFGELISSDDEGFTMNPGDVVCKKCFVVWCAEQDAQREE